MHIATVGASDYRNGMKVLIVAGELGIGGAERQALMLAYGLGEMGHSVSVAVFRQGGAMQADPVARGITVTLLGGNGTLGRLASLRALVARERPDVVHGYLTAGNLASLCALTVGRRPLIVWGVRASNMRMKNYGRKWRLAAWCERCLAGLTDLVIFNSQAGRDAFPARRLPLDSSAVVENGLDLTRFAPMVQEEGVRRQAARDAWGCAAGTVVIGHVARIDPMKDHAGFLRALERLRDACDGWMAVLVAVGAEEDRVRIRTEALALGLSAWVVVTEPPADIVDAYAGFDLLCSSSAYGEGFSNVIAEALACGLPVIATDVGDARRIVGRCGIIVPPSQPEALAAALFEGIARKDALGAGARDRIFPYDQQRLARLTLQALEKALLRLRR